MTRVLYPGSFDPITKGHMNIIEQASNLFEEVIIAVMQNPLKKHSLFTLEERLEMIKEIYKNYANVITIIGSGAAVDVAIEYECNAIVRGLRSLTDFDYEQQLAQLNRDMSLEKINTVCLFANPNLMNISSSAVREIFSLDKDVSRYVCPIVKEKMLTKKVGR